MDGFKKSVYVNAGLILVSFAVFLGAIWFLGYLLQQSGTQLVDQFSNYFYQSYAAERLLSLKQAEPQAQALQRKMELLLPIQDELLNFPDFMTKLSNLKQVTLSLSYPGSITSPSASAAGSISFSFSAAGTLAGLQDFLNALETNNKQYWIGVDSVNFVRSGDSYNLTAQGKVFFRANQ